MQNSFKLIAIVLPLAAHLGCGAGPVEEAEPAEETAAEPVGNQTLAIAAGDPGDGPITPPATGPSAPSNFLPTSRTTSSIRLGWTSPASATSTVLYRRLPGGAWATVRTWGVLSGAQSYNDTGRTSDTPYCYRLKVANADGSKYTNERCAVTDIAQSPGVFRVQLRLRMADVEDAGSDDRMGVSLNYNALGYNHTGLNYARDDFERNSDFTYDLDQKNIRRLHDITDIRIAKYGSDAVCIRSFDLLVNNKVAFTRTYGNTSTTCKWIDGDAPYSPTLHVTHAELRAATSFTGFVSPQASLSVPRAELESRMESLIGNLFWTSSEVKWGHIYGRPVEISYVAPNKFHVDLDLEGVAPWLPNPEVDIDFDMTVGFTQTASGWSLNLESSAFNASVDFAWWAEMLSILLDPICAPIASGASSSVVLDCISKLENYIEEKVESGFTAQSQRIPVSVPAICPTPTVSVQPTGDLLFGCQF